MLLTSSHLTQPSNHTLHFDTTRRQIDLDYSVPSQTHSGVQSVYRSGQSSFSSSRKYMRFAGFLIQSPIHPPSPSLTAQSRTHAHFPSPRSLCRPLSLHPQFHIADLRYSSMISSSSFRQQGHILLAAAREKKKKKKSDPPTSLSHHFSV